jgi:acetyltransferase-like isoleucine patch superfamily enzyme
VLTIGAGAVVGANSVVLNSVPPDEIWAGNPARRVATRQHSKLKTRPVTESGGS